MSRVLTAAVLLPVLWLTLKRGPAWAFYALAILVMMRAVWECYRLLEACGSRPFKLLGLTLSVAVTLSFAAEDPGLLPCLPLMLGTILAITGAMGTRGDPAAMLDTSMSTLFPVLFVGLAFGYAVGLRAFPGEDGTDLPLLLLVCVMFSDTAAFYLGRWLGKRRLSPLLSPKKSWEGALAGLAASTAGGLLAHFWFQQRLPLAHAAILGVLLGLAGILGDLAESMLKRAAGMKDSSHLLPGHGGLLDRADSLLFAAPLLYYYSVVFLGTGAS